MIQEFLDEHPDVVTICYHTPWPGPLDQLYQHNPVQNLARTDYYGIPYVPYAWFDGKIYAYEPTSRYWYDWGYDYVADDVTEVTLAPDGVYDPAAGTVALDVTVTLAAEIPAGDYRLHVVLVENGVAYEPENGQTIHDHVMRRMYPDENGTAITLGAVYPQSHAVVVDLTLDPTYVPENLEFVVFLQDHQEQDVHQAAQIALSDLSLPTPAPDVASMWELGDNYPNPFNPSTTIPLRLAQAGSVDLSIYSADGRLVRRLHAGSLPAGEHRIVWDGRNGKGSSVASGVYVARLSAAGGAVASRRMVLMK